MKKKKSLTAPVLQVGHDYLLGGEMVSVIPADETGCKRCVFEPKCARFAAKSSFIDYHRFCGAYFRGDCQSVVFVVCKQANKRPNLNDNEQKGTNPRKRV